VKPVLTEPDRLEGQFKASEIRKLDEMKNNAKLAGKALQQLKEVDTRRYSIMRKTSKSFMVKDAVRMPTKEGSDVDQRFNLANSYETPGHLPIYVDPRHVDSKPGF